MRLPYNASFIKSHTIWPILWETDKPSAHRILFHVEPLFVGGFFTAQEPIETAGLPAPARLQVLPHPTFQGPNQIAYSRLALVLGRGEKMNMVWHYDARDDRPVTHLRNEMPFRYSGPSRDSRHRR